MIITFHGQQYFKLQTGQTVIALDPLPAKTKGVSKFGSDIALATMYDPEDDAFATVTYGDKEPVAIYGPGSYEVDGMAIQGFGAHIEGEFHTVFTFTFDQMDIGFLGGVTDKKALTPEALEALADADIIFTQGSDDGYGLAKSFSPKLIVAMGYDKPADKDVKELLSGLSKDEYDTVDKLTLSRKDLADKQSFVYAFNAA
jgi:hypothetical protein